MKSPRSSRFRSSGWPLASRRCRVFVRSVGLVRGLVLCGVLGTCSIIGHTLFTAPESWIALRGLAGAAIGGCLITSDIWLRASLSGARRRRVRRAQFVLMLGGLVLGHLALMVLTAGTYVTYNVLAVMCCLALLPLIFAPPVPRIHWHPGRGSWPLAGPAIPLFVQISAFVGGAALAVLLAFGPLYALDTGMSVERMTIFMAGTLLAGLVAAPVIAGLLRVIGIFGLTLMLGAVAVFLCIALGLAQPMPGATTIWVGVGFGAVTLPVLAAALLHLPQTLGRRDRYRRRIALRAIAGGVVGPFMAAATVPFGGFASPFAMLAVLYLVLVLAVAATRVSRPARGAPRGSGRADDAPSDGRAGATAPEDVAGPQPAPVPPRPSAERAHDAARQPLDDADEQGSAAAMGVVPEVPPRMRSRRR